MKDKKIIRTSALFATLCLLCTLCTSCFKSQEDLFDEPASIRMQQNMERVYAVLRSAEYGWEFEYYPGADLAYGGVVYLMKFDSLTVDVQCSLIADSVETSYYRMTNDNGPVLTFDTYNGLLHYFSTPSSSEYEAKGGEFEFVVREINEDEVLLYGKKTHNTAYLRRLKSDPADYVQRTIANYDNFVQSFSGIVEGSVDLSSRSISLMGDSIHIPFAFTDQGIHLYYPVPISGHRVQAFAFDAESNTLTCIDEGAEGLSLQGTPVESSVMRFNQYEGRYNLRYNNGSSAVVILVPNRLEGNYRLTGLSPKYQLVLNYDVVSGDLTLGPQIVGDIDGVSVYLATYNTAGNVWINEACSFTIHWNGNKFYPAYRFSPTNPSVANCNSMMLITLYEDADGGLHAAIVDRGEWQTNGSAVFLYLSQLSKIFN